MDQLDQAMQDDWERRDQCHHDSTVVIDDMTWCNDCNQAIATQCYECGGRRMHLRR